MPLPFFLKFAIGSKQAIVYKGTIYPGNRLPISIKYCRIYAMIVETYQLLKETLAFMAYVLLIRFCLSYGGRAFMSSFSPADGDVEEGKMLTGTNVYALSML